VVDNLRGVMAGAADGLDEARLLPRDAMNAALHALDAWRLDPTATLWYSLPFAEGRKPAD
jgi:hypothetical protein